MTPIIIFPILAAVVALVLSALGWILYLSWPRAIRKCTGYQLTYAGEKNLSVGILLIRAELRALDGKHAIRFRRLWVGPHLASLLRLEANRTPRGNFYLRGRCLFAMEIRQTLSCSAEDARYLLGDGVPPFATINAWVAWAAALAPAVILAMLLTPNIASRAPGDVLQFGVFALCFWIAWTVFFLFLPSLLSAGVCRTVMEDIEREKRTAAPAQPSTPPAPNGRTAENTNRDADA